LVLVGRVVLPDLVDGCGFAAWNASRDGDDEWLWLLDGIDSDVGSVGSHGWL
jgi:hypothetical protein